MKYLDIPIERTHPRGPIGHDNDEFLDAPGLARHAFRSPRSTGGGELVGLITCE
jgi:hypothetical protein